MAERKRGGKGRSRAVNAPDVTPSEIEAAPSEKPAPKAKKTSAKRGAAKPPRAKLSKTKPRVDKAAIDGTTDTAAEKTDSQAESQAAAQPNDKPDETGAKLSTTFLSALSADFELNGAAVIQAIRTENPMGYVKLCASILPKQVNVTGDPLEQMTDEQLLDRARKLTAALNLGHDESRGGRSESNPDRPEPDSDDTGKAAAAQPPGRLPPLH